MLPSIISRSQRACSVPPLPTSTIERRRVASWRVRSRLAYARSMWACSADRSGWFAIILPTAILGIGKFIRPRQPRARPEEVGHAGPVTELESAYGTLIDTRLRVLTWNLW